MPNSKLEELANIIKESKQNMSTPYTVLLGSGLSMTPALLQALDCQNWDAFDALMRSKSPNERYNMLHEPLNNVEQQAGYSCLVQLLKAGYFIILLTANFDSNLDKALDTVGLTDDEMDLLVVGEHRIEHIANALARPQPRIKICMLRGRLRGRTIPNASQAIAFDPQLANRLKTYLEQDVIILGSNSRDIDIHSSIPTDGGSLWYVTPESTPSDFWIKALQQTRSGEIVTGEEADFNYFFSHLAKLLNVQEPESTKAGIAIIEKSSAVVLPSQLVNHIIQVPEETLVETQKPVQEPERANQIIQVPEETSVAIPEQLLDENAEGADFPPVYGTGKHAAVVVGVSDHEKGSPYSLLENCDQDAEMLYKELVLRSFDPSRLVLLTDNTFTPPNHEAILSRLQSIASNTGPDDVLLFYFSGFVDEDDKDGYLVTRNSLPQALQRTAIPLQRVKKIMMVVPTHAKILLLDICHARAAPPFEAQKEHIDRFISRVREGGEGVTILAAYKQQALNSQNSLFASLLKDTFAKLDSRTRNGAVTIEDIYQSLVNGGKLSLVPTAFSENIILYRHSYQVPNSYLLCAYLYVVMAYKTLEDVYNALKTSVIQESLCKRLIKVLKRVSGAPQLETNFPSRNEAALIDSVGAVCEDVERVYDSIVDMRYLSKNSPGSPEIEKRQTATLSELAQVLPSTSAIADQLRNRLIPLDAERESSRL